MRQRLLAQPERSRVLSITDAWLLAESKVKAPIAEAAYEDAIECARSQSAKYYELEATTYFARWLQSQERATEARNLLATIYGFFTEGFDAPVLKEAKALLDELIDKSAVLSEYRRPRQASIAMKKLSSDEPTKTAVSKP